MFSKLLHDWDHDRMTKTRKYKHIDQLTIFSHDIPNYHIQTTPPMSWTSITCYLNIHNMFCSHFQITTRNYPPGNVDVHNFLLPVTSVTLYTQHYVSVVPMGTWPMGDPEYNCVSCPYSFPQHCIPSEHSFGSGLFTGFCLLWINEAKAKSLIFFWISIFILLWIKKARAKDKTYIWGSVWWKTEKLKLRNLHTSHTLGDVIPPVIHI
jgi:hypothetical protein